MLNELIPVDAEVDSEVIELLIVDKPVLNELIPVEAEVESEVTVLFVVLNPVDSELTPVETDAIPVEDREGNQSCARKWKVGMPITGRRGCIVQ